MEKEKEKDLMIAIISAIVGGLIGASIPILINNVKMSKKRTAEFDDLKNELKDLLNKNDIKPHVHVKESKKTTVTDQIFLVPIDKEYIEQIGFGVIGAIKTMSGEDQKGKYNSRMIIGLNTMLEVKEYSGHVEGFKVFKSDNEARLYVTNLLNDKKIVNAKNKEDCIVRLIELINDNKKYDTKD